MARPPITTVGESLYWSYANLAMAHAAVARGASVRDRTDFSIRAKLYSGLTNGTMHLGPHADDERVKMVLPAGCCYCGGRATLSLDHLIPRRLGGADSGDNIVWACRPCNSSKGATDLLEWMQARGQFPPLLLLRRYLKLVIGWCEREGLLGARLDAVDRATLPFTLDRIPHHFPPPGALRLWAVELDPVVDGERPET